MLCKDCRLGFNALRLFQEESSNAGKRKRLFHKECKYIRPLFVVYQFLIQGLSPENYTNMHKGDTLHSDVECCFCACLYNFLLKIFIDFQYDIKM